jgi:hypothetical protein
VIGELLVDLSGGLLVVFCTAAGLLALYGQPATSSGDTLLDSEVE